MSALPFEFNIFFCTEDNLEIPILNWEISKVHDFRIFEAKEHGLSFSLLSRKDGSFELRAENCSDNRICGRVLVRLPWQSPGKGYTLIPGAYYDGNYHEKINDIPRLHMPEHSQFRISVSALSVPSVLFWNGEKSGFNYYISPRSAAGWNGIALDGEKETVTLCVPAGDDYKYSGGECVAQKREPYSWENGDVLSVCFSVDKFTCENVPDIFHYLWEKGRRLKKYPAENHPRFDAQEAIELVRNWMFRKHFIRGKHSEPMFLNAFTDIDAENEAPSWSEWNIMIGWCSGSMTALPFLKFGGDYRKAALEYLDFITTDGFAPSGVKLPIFDSEKWIDPKSENGEAGYRHCRFYCDYLYYLGRAISFEKSNGFCHPQWETVFESGMDILTDLWEREHDFGLYWNIDNAQVTLDRKGSCAGAFALLAMTEGARHYPENLKLRKALTEATEEYVNRCVFTGHCNGGPNDIFESDDSESAAALSDALVQQYKLFGTSELKNCAIKAAELFASWVLCYKAPFPGGTTLEGINVCGGVIANVQNRHVGPGICTNSARFLYDLGKITGDNRWIELYHQVRSAAINCICRYDGEFFGSSFKEPFAAGMVSEQINVTDVLGASGNTWRVSASWPATDILLSWFDEP
jgi:hypothetical protein